MTEETKGQLMLVLQKIAEHNGLQDVASVSFKKRAKLMDVLKEKNEDAWQVVNSFFDAQIKLNRLQNDQEKQAKNATQWSLEIETAELQKKEAEENIHLFFEKNNIVI
jgi:hypothetical protein